MQMPNVGNGRGGTLQGRSHQLVVHYQIVDHENVDTGSNIWTE